jgi:hypothetical protein
MIESVRSEGAGLLVIDHLSQILGNVDENTSQVAGIMASLRGMAESLNLAIVLIHHQVKGSTRFGITASDSLRGHGSILASCDLAAMVERRTLDRNSVNVKPVACRGPALENFAAKFAWTSRVDGSLELQEARFFGIDISSVEAEIEAAVVEILEDSSGLNQTELRTQVAEQVEAAGDPAIRAALVRMKKADKIKTKRGKQNAILYRLAGEDD